MRGCLAPRDGLGLKTVPTRVWPPRAIQPSGRQERVRGIASCRWQHGLALVWLALGWLLSTGTLQAGMASGAACVYPEGVCTTCWSQQQTASPDATLPVLLQFFVVGHDCGHRSFSKNKLLEDIVGTLAFAPLIYPFEPWRIKHNHHHAHTNKCVQGCYIQLHAAPPPRSHQLSANKVAACHCTRCRAQMPSCLMSLLSSMSSMGCLSSSAQGAGQ